MLEKFRQRSYELEHLDKGDYTAQEYEGCLVELRRVNRWLGDAGALKISLLKDVEAAGLKSFSVLDVGAGSGELLRIMAQWGRETNRLTQLVGLELNERSARAILEESLEFTQIASVQADAFRLPFADRQFEYTMCSLFTHHFRDPQVIDLLNEMCRVTRRRIFVIDLHRNAVAYFFYRTVARLFLHNRLIREDGALSILRSFTPEELETLGQQSKLRQVTVEKHFPSRLILSAMPNAHDD